MNRRNGKRLTFSIFEWLLESLAVIFGIVPQLRTIRRISRTRKCRNTLEAHRTFKRQKFLRIKGKFPCPETSIVSYVNILVENAFSGYVEYGRY